MEKPLSCGSQDSSLTHASMKFMKKGHTQQELKALDKVPTPNGGGIGEEDKLILCAVMEKMATCVWIEKTTRGTPSSHHDLRKLGGIVHTNCPQKIIAIIGNVKSWGGSARSSRQEDKCSA